MDPLIQLHDLQEGTTGHQREVLQVIGKLHSRQRDAEYVMQREEEQRKEDISRQDGFAKDAQENQDFVLKKNVLKFITLNSTSLNISRINEL